MKSGEILHHLLQNIHGQHVTGIFSCDKIKNPSKKKKNKKIPCAYIFNTDPHYEKGQHWVAVYIDKSKNGYYFDSYGIAPMKNEFIDFLKSNCIKYIYNNIRVQDTVSSACGQFCLYFLIHMSYGWSMDDIIDTLKNRSDYEVLQYVDHLC